MMRAKALGLYVLPPLDQAVLNVATYLSSMLANYNYTGRYKGRQR